MKLSEYDEDRAKRDPFVGGVEVCRGVSWGIGEVLGGRWVWGCGGVLGGGVLGGGGGGGVGGRAWGVGGG